MTREAAVSRRITAVALVTLAAVALVACSGPKAPGPSVRAARTTAPANALDAATAVAT